MTAKSNYESSVSGKTDGTLFSWPISHRKVLIVVIVCHGILLTIMGLFRHWGNMTSINDLGFFDQAVWGTLNGHWFLDTNTPLGKPTNWLSCHANFFLLLFVPLYALWPSVTWFILAQAWALSLAAWPLFLHASRISGSDKSGLKWAIIYLFNPFLLNAASWDFHPVSLAVPLIATALYAIERKRLPVLTICCLALLLIQEQCGLVVAGFAGLWWLKTRRMKSSFLLAGAGILHTVIVLGILMPALSASGSHSMIIDPTAQDSRYGWLGSTLQEIFLNLIIHPVSVLNTILIDHEGTKYFACLALPFWGLFCLAPSWLLPAVADLAANTLSANAMPRAIISYHSVTMVPILTIASAHGINRLQQRLMRFRITERVTTVTLLTTIALAYIFAPLPLAGALNFWRPTQWAQFPDTTIARIQRAIPPNASISVQANVGAHFTEHSQVVRFPTLAGSADIFVLRLASPTTRLAPQDPHAIGTLAHHLQMKPAHYLAEIACLAENPNYATSYWQDTWLVFSRQSRNSTDSSAILMQINSLIKDWDVPLQEYEDHLHRCRERTLLSAADRLKPLDIVK